MDITSVRKGQRYRWYDNCGILEVMEDGEEGRYLGRSGWIQFRVLENWPCGPHIGTANLFHYDKIVSGILILLKGQEAPKGK